MSDLVERLKKAARVQYQASQTAGSPEDFMEWEAADEIERLKEAAKTGVRCMEQRNEAYAEIERLRERIKFIYTSSNGDLYERIEQLTAEVLSLQQIHVARVKECERLEDQNAKLQAVVEFASQQPCVAFDQECVHCYALAALEDE